MKEVLRELATGRGTGGSNRTEGPIVVAGHAYAGAVIALARPERLKALVYVTALAPDQGEKVADVFYRLEPHP